MEIPTGKHILATAARRHFLSALSLVARQLALAVIIVIAVTVALGAWSLRRTIGIAHTYNLGTDTTAT
jgi:hypothetical protein